MTAKYREKAALPVAASLDLHLFQSMFPDRGIGGETILAEVNKDIPEQIRNIVRHRDETGIQIGERCVVRYICRVAHIPLGSIDEPMRTS
jgi:hypothetical protein